jgi:hypothetical protein
MGAWGFSSFENDDALDWVIDLEEAPDMTILEVTLAAVLDSEEDYLDASICCFALAAAEVVAALGGNPSAKLPEEVTQWVEGKGKPDSSLVSTAKSVIQAILDDSELKELWEETDEFEMWLDDVQGLLGRLG